jgi:hypothetical protein
VCVYRAWVCTAGVDVSGAGLGVGGVISMLPCYPNLSGRFWGAGTGSVLLWETRVWLLLPNSRPNPLVVCAYHVLTCCSTTACCNTNSQQPTACATFGAAAAWRVLSSAGVCCAGTVLMLPFSAPCPLRILLGPMMGGREGGGVCSVCPPTLLLPVSGPQSSGQRRAGASGIGSRRVS